jgi:DNA polymerase-3 subunit beta
MKLKYSILKKDFLESLNYLQNITSKRSNLAILSNILIESSGNNIKLTATDLEVGVNLTIPAEIHNEGSITLPARKIFEIVRESGSETIIIEEIENNWVIIKTGLSTYNLAGISDKEFPEFPQYDKDNFITIEANIFSELTDKVIFSIANEQENVYSLTSVLFEIEEKDESYIFKMVSSNGHRLSFIEKEISLSEDINLPDKILIPKTGIKELRKFCENRDFIDISFEEKQLIIQEDESVLVIRLKKGEFPQYGDIINSVILENSIKINRLPFLESLKRINLFTDDNYNTIKIKIIKNKIILSSQNADIGNAKDEQEIDYQGEELLIGFNCRYFIETLQVMEDEQIDVFINSQKSPCLIKSEKDKGFISIIMPMQI